MTLTCTKSKLKTPEQCMKSIQRHDSIFEKALGEFSPEEFPWSILPNQIPPW